MRIAVAARAPFTGGRFVRSVRGLIPRRIVALGIVAIGLATFQVWLQLQVRAVAYELSEVRRLQSRLEHRERELQIQLETEREPLRLKSRAMQRLGMAEPQRGQVVDVQ